MPHAALRLKQGFGRLIRSKSDIGIVILMDSRVTTRNYGGKLLASLPPARRVVDGLSVVQEEVNEFFATHGIGVPF
jgi:ATP-dependent DNA helicase DinG